MKRVLSIVLSFALLLSFSSNLAMTSFAADGDITATVQGSYTKSEAEQDITIRLELPNVSEAYAAFYIDTGIALPDGFVIKSFVTSNTAAQITAVDYSVSDGKLNYDPVPSTNSIPVGTYYDVVITAPASASGVFAIEFQDVSATDSTYNNVVAEASVVTATLTIKEEVPDYYNAIPEGAATNGDPIRVGDTFEVELGVNKEFYATQMEITYPKELVSFVPDENATYTIEEDTATATLKLADYGDAKGTDFKYTLTFTANADGPADFHITSAKFGNGVDAVDRTLTEGVGGMCTLMIEKKQHTVTLSPVDIFAGDETVLDGETYTFTPETATGAYYDYTITSVLMDVQDVTESVTGDATEGWSIADVTGNLTITGTRTPKVYNVTWTGDGAADMDADAKADKATYGTDFVFTIPSDIPKNETTDGYIYGANISINGYPYSVDVSGKTYTISGTSITDNVTIEVTKTLDAADKVTVKVEGSTDITINENTPSSGSVNVEKNQDVVVEVKPENGYSYEVAVDGEKVELNGENKYTIPADQVDADTTINVTKTINVTDVTNVNGDGKNFVKADEIVMYLIKMPDHIQMQEAGAAKNKAYTYDGKPMYWSETYGTYVTTVFSDTEPAIDHTKFAIIDVAATPEIAPSYDVNQSGVVDANDAQLIWNMYEAWYDDFSVVPETKFILADANGDGVLDMNDATFIINHILEIATGSI